MLETSPAEKKQSQFDWQLMLILLVAAYIRLLLLDLRPAHHDEGVNGWFADQVTEHGFYKYDPTNYHGPLTFYILFIFQTLFGHNIWALRLPTVIVSLLTIYWITLFARFVGRPAVLLAALAFALSPGNIYFSRFVNIDALLVFFQVVVIWGIMGLWSEGSKKYLWALGLGICGMVLTKETYIIHIVCLVLAFLFWRFIYPTKEIPKATQSWTKRDLGIVTATSLGLIIFFYSSTFSNFSGLLDMFTTFKAWLTTGAKRGGHEKPFLYWVTVFSKYEHIGLLGLIGCIRYYFYSPKWIRYIAIYGMGVFLVYSIINYKTPWLVVNLLWPLYFVFGDTVAQIAKTRFRFLVSIACAILFFYSLIVSVRLNFIDYCNHKEPYVYVQTFNDIKKITSPLSKLTRKDSSNYYTLTGSILRDDEWPIPWLLADFTMVYYYRYQNSPPSYDADFLFVESKRINEVEGSLQKKYFTEIFQLRDAQDPSKLYLSYEKFKDVFRDREPEFIPADFESTGPIQGILASFYPNATWSGNPVLKKIVNNIDFHWEDNNRPFPPPFSVKFLGEINIESNTALILYTDDGGYVELDGTRVINDLGPHAVQPKSSNIISPPGWRKLEAGFYDLGGGAIVRLQKIGENKIEELISKSELRYDKGSLNR